AQRARRFRADPEGFAQEYAAATVRAAESIERARRIVNDVELTPEAEQLAVALTMGLGIESHRAEIVLMEAARAYAAIDERLEAGPGDIVAVAPPALRRRKS